MKKIILAILFIASLALNAAAQAKLSYVDGSFHATNDADIATSGTDLGKKNMTAAISQYRASHNYGEAVPTGIIRVSFKNVANEDIKDKVKASAYPIHIMDIEYRTNKQNATEAWIQIDPDDDITLVITVEGFSPVRIPHLKVGSKQMYALELQSAETLPVTFGSNVDGTIIYLDGQILEGRTGNGAYVRKEKTTMGTHHLKAQVNGRTREMDIEVAKGHTHFDVDMKNKYTVEFKSNEPGVELWENDNMLGIMPITLDVDEGPHTYCVKKYGYDEVAHNINIASDSQQQLDIHKSKTIDFISLSNNVDIAGANIYINDILVGQTPSPINLPYGDYKVRMSYLSRDKTEHIKVNDKTPSRFMVSLPAIQKRFNPFDIDFHKRQFGLTAAFVQKWIHVSNENQTADLNYYGEEKHMSGFQVGVPVQPVIKYGLGINTGLYFEGYFASSEDPVYGDKMSLTELGLYMPVDLMFRLPIAEEFSIFVNGGIGIDWTLNIKCSQDGYDDWNIELGEEGAPNRFNFSGEFGGGIQFKALQLSGNYQLGLNNNSNIVDEGASAKIRKFSIQLSAMF